MERVHLQIHGRVQGVCFRAAAQKEANRLGVDGWIRNAEDEGVEVLAQGPRRELEAFVEWCNHGPPSAIVQKVDLVWEPAHRIEQGFRIRY